MKSAFSPSWVRVSAALLLGSLALAGVAHASGRASFPLLDRLEKGQWTLTERGQAKPMRKICLGDASVLLRPEHRGGQCAQYILDNEPAHLSIHYKCSAMGHGNTIIRHETNRVVQIETQGIVNGQPFERSIEARRVGACQR
jgi:hypothetical protein